MDHKTAKNHSGDLKQAARFLDAKLVYDGQYEGQLG
jgi:hypothetical protein